MYLTLSSADTNGKEFANCVVGAADKYVAGGEHSVLYSPQDQTVVQTHQFLKSH